MARLQWRDWRSRCDEKGILPNRASRFTIVPGGLNVDGVAGVVAGQSTRSALSSPSITLARSAGVPVKAFLAGYRASLRISRTGQAYRRRRT